MGVLIGTTLLCILLVIFGTSLVFLESPKTGILWGLIGVLFTLVILGLAYDQGQQDLIDSDKRIEQIILEKDLLKLQQDQEELEDKLSILQEKSDD